MNTKQYEMIKEKILDLSASVSELNHVNQIIGSHSCHKTPMKNDLKNQLKEYSIELCHTIETQIFEINSYLNEKNIDVQNLKGGLYSSELTDSIEACLYDLACTAPVDE